MKTPVVVAVVLCALLLTGVAAEAVLQDFETLSDSEEVTTQLAGMTFANTVALQSFAAGGSLVEEQFPPFSGVTVVSNGSSTTFGGAIVLAFDAPVSAVSGRFTYGSSLVLTAFDAGGEVASVSSVFPANFDEDFDPSTPLNADGSAPNELIHVAVAGGFHQLVITPADLQTTFTLDDLNFTLAPVRTVPEPRTLALVALGLALLATRRLMRRVAPVRAR